MKETTIGETWDFAFYERQRKVAAMITEYERVRALKHKLGIDIDDWEAKKNETP